MQLRTEDYTMIGKGLEGDKSGLCKIIQHTGRWGQWIRLDYIMDFNVRTGNWIGLDQGLWGENFGLYQGQEDEYRIL